MKPTEMRLLLRDWEGAGLLPERLFDELLWLFSTVPQAAEQAHLAAFNWWFRKPPNKDDLMRLADLLRNLQLDEADKSWIAETVRRANACDADIEALLSW